MKPATHWIPAVMLSLLVVACFGALNGAGPESVLRRFHVAAANRDFQQMQSVCIQGASAGAITTLGNQVSAYARSGGRYLVRKIVRRRNSGLAEINYISPNGQQVVPVLFVLKKDRGRWYVDPDETLMRRYQLYGPPGNEYL